MNNAKLTPEALYQRYQETRDVTVERLHGTAHSTGETLAGETLAGNTLAGNTLAGNTLAGNTLADNTLADNTLAGRAYSQFRQQRESNRKESIDSIMEMLDIKKQPAATVNNSLSAAFVWPSHALGRLLSQPVVRYCTVSALAAGLLAIVLAPQLLTDSRPASSLPDSMASNARAMTGLIEQRNTVTLGLSETADSRQAAFNRGVLSVDLALAVDSGEMTVLGNMLSYIVSMGTEQGQPELSSSAQMLELAIVQGNSDAELIEHLVTDVLNRLSVIGAGTPDELWFLQGQSVEAIAITAGFAIDAQDIQPLQEALSMNSTLATDSNPHAATRLIDTLRQAASNTSLSLSDARHVLSTAIDIKTLMQ